MKRSNLTLEKASDILQDNFLLREIIQRHPNVTQEDVEKDPTYSKVETWSTNPKDFPDFKKPFNHATYDTRDIKPGTLLFIKGNFKEEYLADADKLGLKAYVAERSYSNYTNAIGLIVTDVRKAMSILSAEYFGNPQEKLKIVGITGTKGKTTTAYFTHKILNTHSKGKAALFSSVDNCLDGKTYVESDLTTPESFDSFKMMREAVNNGMKYLVMEVSSQAYKINRVSNINFDVAAFLNISPDHISPIEHPTFEDYFYCKRQIVENTKNLVLGSEINHGDLIVQNANECDVNILSFARIRKDELENNPCDCKNCEYPCDCNDCDLCKKYHNSYDSLRYPELAHPFYIAIPSKVDNEAYEIMKMDLTDEYLERISSMSVTRGVFDNPPYKSIGEFKLSIAGDFNYDNAMAALAIANMLNIDEDNDEKALRAIEEVKIPGRMEIFEDSKSNTIAIVDYAHNYISVKSILDFVNERYGDKNPRITLIAGSAGNKAYDRRKEIVEAAQDRIKQFIFTIEDTNTEDPMDICESMKGYITNQNVESSIIIDRDEAIESCISDVRKRYEENNDQLNIILIIGKGDEKWIKRLNKHVPYEGDSFIVKRVFEID
ncbi:UDP-N-acetylmuramoyl-L-alanyl-D-glutamate--2,6-diaminopimelate ligase [Gardnerella vaginalis]|uniref:UDP-N-acetylmuramoyl-L-alanyl-D-glutamate--2, 6-diaminopimelate ligase n=1 Tax=Gardnerella vaginalis TaxID=2702 RepID=UPI0039EFA774